MEKDKKNSYYDDVYEVKTSELWKYYNNESDDQR